MDADPDWIVSTVDGKIAAISLDFTIFTEIMKKISRLPADSVSEIKCFEMKTEEVLAMSGSVRWEDLRLFGSTFQKMVWKKLFELNHPAPESEHPGLMSYTGFAEICGKKTGVRAVAHAVAQNPVAIIIPCHLIVPKEAMDRIDEIERQAENSLFGTDGLIPDPSLDFGEYRYGKELKRRLITWKHGKGAAQKTGITRDF